MTDRPAAMLLGGAILASLLVGVGVAVNPDLGLALGALVAVVAIVAAPAGAYLLVALVAALTFKGLVTLQLLPPIAVFLDIPLVWAALAVAALKRRSWSREAILVVRWLAALSVLVILSWAFHPSEVVRPFLYLALLGEPFAVVAALLLDPPNRTVARALAGTAMGLVLIQIPFAYGQANEHGVSDLVQGTLAGAGAGAHTMSAVVVIGIVWLLAGLPRGAGWRLPLVALLLPIPLLADARQVLLALPFIALVGRGGQGRTAFVLRMGAVAASLAFLLVFTESGGSAVMFVERSVSQGSGKVLAARLVMGEIAEEQSSLVLGKGPAQTVSRAAFMTTDLLLRDESPLRALNLQPATFPEEITQEMGFAGAGSSFAAGLSSALGVLGDLGLAGIAAYLGLLGTVFILTRRVRSPIGMAAASGWAIFAPLGLVFDWWEQPPFGVFIGVLSGLALTMRHRDADAPAEGTPEHAAAGLPS